MGIEVVVCNSKRETLLVMENFQSFMGYVELGEALALHEGIAYALEANIYPLRDEIDSLIL